MMETKITKVQEAKELLERLQGSAELKRAEGAMARVQAHFRICLAGKEADSDGKKLAEKAYRPLKTGGGMKKACIKAMGRAAERCEKSKKAELFECPGPVYGFCYPLIDCNAVFGYAIGYKFTTKPPQEELALLGGLIETALSNVEKDIQLEQLRNSIKPMSIALSTVHTIHRLISSTHFLNQLLARIARLSMQIIGASRCSIKLLDSKKKTLLPKATVDLRTKKARLKKVKIGRWAPGKAVKYGKSIGGEKYLATPLIDEDVIGVITLYDKVDSSSFNNSDTEIMRTLAEQAAVAIKNARLYKEQENLTAGSIRALAQLIESRSAGICTPKSSFLKIIRLIGLEFKMREYELKMLQYATLLHDTGELMVPERLIRKKGRLTKEEYQVIKEHPLKGARIIKSLKSLKAIAPIIMCHHENFDGSGYPKGLKGSEIPLGARILAVVGAFEAMITRRPYRIPIPIGKAIEEIKKNSGKQFDPKVVAAFLKVAKRKDVLTLIKKDVRGAPRTRKKIK